jgi:hypothetical protein
MDGVGSAPPRAAESPPPLLRVLLEQVALELGMPAGRLEFRFRGGELREWRTLPDARPARQLPRVEAPG